MSIPQDKLDLTDIAEPPPAPRAGLRPRKSPAPAAAPSFDVADIAEPPRARSSSSSKGGAPATAPPRNPYSADDFNLDGDWSPERAEGVKSWFKQTYARDLPHRFGQTATHDRMGLDHSRNMDVQLSPQSDEGRALAAYLRENRIPFLAYNKAKAGAATGPHFHVGHPSHRGTPGAGSQGFDLSDLAEAAPAPVESADPGRQALVDDYGPAETINATAATPSATPAPLREREMFDPTTEEGRRGRDERAQIERTPGAFLEVAAPLPPAERLSDVAAGGEMVRAAYVRELVARGVPEAEASKLVGSDYSLKNAKGEAVAPGDAFSDDNLDAAARTMRVKLDAAHVSKLVDSYRAGRGTLARVSEWATDDERSPGEKALDVAAPVVGTVARGADLVTRPLQAIDAGFWSKVKGVDNVAALKVAYDQFFGDNPALGRNLIADALKDSDRLKAINPRLPALLGELANMVLQPSNLIPVGAVAKGGKLLRAGEEAGRVGRLLEGVGGAARRVGALDRGLIEARPLGLAEEVGARAASGIDDAADVLRPAASSAADVGGKAKLEALDYRVERVSAPNRTAAGEAGEVWKVTDAEGRSNIMRDDAELDDFAEMVAGRAAQSAEPFDVADLAERNPDAFDDAALLDDARSRAERFRRSAAAEPDPRRRRVYEGTAAEYEAEAVRLEGGNAPPAAVRQARARKALDSLLGVAGDGVDAVKSNLFSADVSAPLRQALFPLMFETRATAKGLVEGLPSFFPSRHRRFVEHMRGDALAQEADDMGLALASLDPAAKSEYFPSRAASKLPWVGTSERIMEAQLDAVRLNVYKRLTKELRAAGLTPETAPEDFRDVARIVNVASGHGEPVALLSHPATSKVLGSPKLLTSRFQVLNPLEYARLSPRARRIALRKLGRTAASFTGLFGLAALTADEVGIDPRKPNFGTARWGNTSFDLTGGQASKIRFIVNLVRSVGETAKVATSGGSIAYEETPVGVATHFLRSQLSPVASLVPDVLTGKDYNGRDFTWTEGAIRRAVPLIGQDIFDGYTAGGTVGALKTLPAFLGVGVRSFDEERVKRQWGRANNRPVPVELTEPAQRELKRLGVDLKKLKADVVQPGYKVEGTDGEALAPMRKDDGTGLAQVSADDIAHDLAEELSAAVEEAVDSPDYASFESDAARGKYLAQVVRFARARVYAGLRLKSRARQLEDLRQVEEYQQQLEDRSLRLMPGQTLKLGEGGGVSTRRLLNLDGVRERTNVEDLREPAQVEETGGAAGGTVNPLMNFDGQRAAPAEGAAGHGRTMNLEGVRESVNVEDVRADGPFDPAVDEIRRVGPSPVTEAQAADAALLIDSLDERRFLSFARNLADDGRLGVAAEGASAAFEYGARAAGALGSGDASDAAEVVAVRRMLARERRLRPEQFTRDALAGRYGAAVRSEVEEGGILTPAPARVVAPMVAR